MTALLARTLAALVGATSAMLVVAAVIACAQLPTPTQQAGVAAWTVGDQDCVAHASTRAEAVDCQDRLRVLFCGDGGFYAADSGACLDVRLSDGGRP